MTAKEDLTCWAIIPATGVGSRMQADRPKQYLSLCGKTILEQTLDNLLAFPPICGAILVLNETDSFWPTLDYQSSKPLFTTIGGASRHHSVLNGLISLKQKVSGNPLVFVHDAVRPLVTHDDLNKLLDVVKNHVDGGLLASPVADTLKQADAANNCQSTISRANLWRAFTPQAFRLDLLTHALNTVIEQNLAVTDDASAVELLGWKPRLVDSSPENIKITRPDDLKLAAALMQSRPINK